MSAKPSDRSNDAELFRAAQDAIHAVAGAEFAASGEQIREAARARIAVAPRRNPVPRRAFVVTACAVFVAVGIAVLSPVLRPDRAPATNGVAYARVEQAMAQVRYVEWKSTRRNVNVEGEAAIITIEKTYARLNGRNSALLQDDVDRIVFGARNHYPALWKKKILFDKRGRTIYYYDTKKSVFIPAKEPSFSKVKSLGATILQKINAPKIGSPVQEKRPPFSFPGVGVKSVTSDTGWAQTTERTTDGKPILVFRGRAAIDDTLTFEKKKIAMSARYERTVWVEPDTLHVVRSEYVTRQKGGFDTTTICDHFVYNVPPPAGTFDWKIPAQPATKTKSPR